MENLCRVLAANSVTCSYIDKSVPFQNRISVIHNIFVKFLQTIYIYIYKNRTTLPWTLVIAPDVNRANSLTAPTSSVVLKVKFSIKDNFSCTTKDVIYTITCAKCDSVYVGETKHMIAERFRQHFFDIDKADTTKPVPKHLTTNNHTKNDLLISGIVRKCQGDTNSRRRQEQQIIFQLGTLFPHGYEH